MGYPPQGPPPGYAPPPPGYAPPPQGYYQQPPPGYAPPPQGYPQPGMQTATTTNVVVVGQQQPIMVSQTYTGCCADAMIDCSETTGMIILILNILWPGFGTFLSSCLDRNGCNMSAFCLSFAQAFLVVVCFLGWAMSIIHGLAVYNFNKGKL